MPTNLSKQDSVPNSIKGFRAGVNAAELLKNKTFSMEEHSYTLREIWERITVNVHGSGFTGVLVSDLPIKPILVFLVKEGVVPDREKAKKVINEELGGVEEEGKISFSEWNRLFAKGVFK